MAASAAVASVGQSAPARSGLNPRARRGEGVVLDQTLRINGIDMRYAYRNRKE